MVFVGCDFSHHIRLIQQSDLTNVGLANKYNFSRSGKIDDNNIVGQAIYWKREYNLYGSGETEDQYLAISSNTSSILVQGATGKLLGEQKEIYEAMGVGVWGGNAGYKSDRLLDGYQVAL